MRFTLEFNPRYHMEGIQITAPVGKVFVPGILCQLIVALCSELNVSFLKYPFLCLLDPFFDLDEKIFYHEIIKIASNAILLTCAGVMDGQLMVFADPKNVFRSIQFLALASNPNLDQVVEIFNATFSKLFPSCIHAHSTHYLLLSVLDNGCSQQQLCRQCLKIVFSPDIRNSSPHLPNPYCFESGAIVSLFFFSFFS